MPHTPLFTSKSIDSIPVIFTAGRVTRTRRRILRSSFPGRCHCTQPGLAFWVPALADGRRAPRRAGLGGLAHLGARGGAPRAAGHGPRDEEDEGGDGDGDQGAVEDEDLPGGLTQRAFKLGQAGDSGEAGPGFVRRALASRGSLKNCRCLQWRLVRGWVGLRSPRSRRAAALGFRTRSRR